MGEPTQNRLRETADRLDKIMEVSSPWVHAKLTPMLRDAADVIEGLEHENSKLRELVADMWHELHAEEGSAQRRMALADRMSELGVEVDDGGDLV